MADSTTRMFGIVVAYVVPGFVGLTGLIPVFPVVSDWLQPVENQSLGFGPTIYAILGATAVGLIISCFRWLLLDQAHYWTGLRRPRLDLAKLPEVLEELDYLVQSHYRYFEFTGNMLIGALWAYAMNRVFGLQPFLGTGTDLGMVILSLVLFTAGRDALVNYYLQTGQLVGLVAEKADGGSNMFNGKHHEEGSGEAPKKPPTPNKAEKPEANQVTPPAKEREANPKPKK